MRAAEFFAPLPLERLVRLMRLMRSTWHSDHAPRPPRGGTRLGVVCVGLIWGLSLTLCQALARSEEETTWVSADARLVTFDYDAERTYLVLTRPKVVTHLQLPDDETVSTLVVGDTANFSVVLSANRHHVLIRPKYEGLSTSVTLITSAREYPLILRSTKEGSGKWYQRVSWNTPALRLEEFEQEAAYRLSALSRRAASKGVGALHLRAPSAGVEDGGEEDMQDSTSNPRTTSTTSTTSSSGTTRMRINLDLIRTNYSIEGRADFKPLSVFDDGNKTFIRLPDHYQNFPAIFAWQGGLTQLVNYSVEEHYIVVQGVHAGMVLKLGSAEVKITREVKEASSWFGGSP